MKKQLNVSFDKAGGEVLDYIREVARQENRSVSAQVRHILAVWAREHRDQSGQVYFGLINQHGGVMIDAYRIDSHGYRTHLDLAECGDLFGTVETAIAWGESQGWKYRIA